MKILVCISNVPDTTSKINFVESDTKFEEKFEGSLCLTLLLGRVGLALPAKHQ